jgi:uncharacterized ubiquitin-like protein YukD
MSLFKFSKPDEPIYSPKIIGPEITFTVVNMAGKYKEFKVPNTTTVYKLLELIYDSKLVDSPIGMMRLVKMTNNDSNFTELNIHGKSLDEYGIKNGDTLDILMKIHPNVPEDIIEPPALVLQRHGGKRYRRKSHRRRKRNTRGKKSRKH